MSVEESIEALKRQLNDHEKRILELEKQPVTQITTPAVKKLSIREFLLEKKPKGHVQTTLVIGYYLEKNDCYTSFNVNDLEAGYKAAKEPPPNNININVTKNIEQGFMMDVDEKKDNKLAWTLTNRGEQRVENGLDNKS
jgi:hypothetical protein